MQIAVIDDDKAVLKYFELVFRKDHEARLYAFASDFLEDVDNHAYRPDVVIVDAVMPYMDGIDLINAIRFRDLNPRIIICTALNGQEHSILAQGMGVEIIHKTPNLTEELVKCRLISRS